MKCIVFGLGNFGLALSQRLTKRGNEVLGVDSDISKINLYKESITNTVALDVKNAQALQTLPLLDVDVVFVVFGKDFGTSLFVIALLKQFGVKRIVARSISPVHKVILTSMGITEIVNPEWEYADFFATKVELGTTIDSYVVDDDHLIIEWEVHSTFVGRKLEDANFEEEFGLKLVALKRYDAKADKTLVMDNPPADLVFTTKDVFVLFGQPKNFRKLGIQIA
ncbi:MULTISPECIES: potassium channel family protein [Butyricimonas]|uniref:potassium channel family protein n=1 Tax=Butyricimonas TaxID=574697 RepID=UPI001D0848D6|nr:MULTISPECIES: NAD-binding protein [Butyricimonas]MCB6972250.1 NAD-binding protein [Butyricimonas synergistica]MCG4519187.1 NAD-binding protein [Butyricimonas sp. DFI.6.44]